MVQKIIPLEDSLASTRNELQSSADEMHASISSHVDALRSDMKGAMSYDTGVLALSCQCMIMSHSVL